MSIIKASMLMGIGMAKRFTITANTQVENTALEENLDDSLIELQLKPSVIHRGIEVLDPAQYFSYEIRSHTDTPWETKRSTKSLYCPSSRVASLPSPNENKATSELPTSTTLRTITVKAKSTGEDSQGIAIKTIATTESVPPAIPAEPNTDIQSEAALSGEGSCCGNCTIL